MPKPGQQSESKTDTGASYMIVDTDELGVAEREKLTEAEFDVEPVSRLFASKLAAVREPGRHTGRS